MMARERFIKCICMHLLYSQWVQAFEKVFAGASGPTGVGFAIDCYCTVPLGLATLLYIRPVVFVKWGWY